MRPAYAQEATPSNWASAPIALLSCMQQLFSNSSRTDVTLMSAAGASWAAEVTVRAELMSGMCTFVP